VGGFGTEQDQVQQDSEKNPEKVWEVLVQSEPRQIQQDSREKKVGGIGTEPGPSGFGRRYGRFWCRTRSNSSGFRKKFRQALVQRQVKFIKLCDHLVYENY
jgi:hypothetical protein